MCNCNSNNKNMKISERKISAKNLLTELIKFKSHQKYLDRDLPKIDIRLHAPELDKLKMDQEINLPIQIKNIQFETQHLMHMVADFKERMINVASLFNHNTKKYREEIQSIDDQMRKVDAKNMSELKLLKLEYCQIEESTLDTIIFARNRSLTQHGLAKSATHSTTERKVTSAPIRRNAGSDCTTRQMGSSTSE